MAFPMKNTHFGANILIFLIVLVCVNSKKAIFTFPEFQYKETTKNEMAYREYESACEQTPACMHLKGVLKTRCVRDCVSPSCYLDIYKADELEEGEIDVRLNSFKGCFIQRVMRQRP